MRTLLFFLSLSLTAPALAAPLDDARAAHAAARADLTRIDAARQELAAAHEALAAEIEALKTIADNPLLPGVRDPRLDARLKQARALSERLAGHDRDAADAESRVDAARDALVELIDAELARRRAALAAAPVAERRVLFEGLGRLIEERQALARADRPRLQAAPALPEPPGDELASPDELRELADETRDHAEQVRARLMTLESRLEALRERQRLVRAAVAFARDDALFVQDERNRQRVRREEGIAVAVPGEGRPAAAGNEPSPPLAEAPADRGGEEGAGGGDDGEFAESDGPPAFAGAEGDADGAADPAPGGDLGEVAQPPLAVPELPGELAAGGGGVLIVEETFDPSLLDDVDALSADAIARRIRQIEARRAKLLETRSTLESRSAELEARAQALESE
ncbi:MAG: hypothetical protein H6703_11690 [Myxococcales bacterium]|nr:hypothetical protein [Myxococcales bacterium]